MLHERRPNRRIIRLLPSALASPARASRAMRRRPRRRHPSRRRGCRFNHRTLLARLPRAARPHVDHARARERAPSPRSSSRAVAIDRHRPPSSSSVAVCRRRATSPVDLSVLIDPARARIDRCSISIKRALESDAISIARARSIDHASDRGRARPRRGVVGTRARARRHRGARGASARIERATVVVCVV